MVKYRKVTDFILSTFSHFANRIESALDMLEVELHLQYSSPSNLEYLVLPYESLLCRTRSFSSLSLPSRHHLVDILFNICGNNFQFASYLG